MSDSITNGAACSTCLNWEPRQNSGMGDGYCPILDKFTDPDHGKHCTAFQPNAERICRDEAEKSNKP